MFFLGFFLVFFAALPFQAFNKERLLCASLLSAALCKLSRSAAELVVRTAKSAVTALAFQRPESK